MKDSKFYNPEIHHRRSIRLQGYDYSLKGAYFFTICTQNKATIFGEIDDKTMILNNAGKMVEHWLMSIKNKFNDAVINEYVIMPNHLHCIISFINAKPVGADLCVCPVTDTDLGQTQMANTQVRPYKLCEIIRWLKTITTNEYIKGVKTGIYPAFNGRVWQRNYFERIIRNKTEFNKISEYIVNNPLNWLTDENNVEQNVGADLRVCPVIDTDPGQTERANTCSPLQIRN